ncbi:class I fructose-bisphosphate aldolase [Mesorhizobium marinum]|uniref:Class I fructose-bisphosphate aldolase n=1 Tax=Mesorhizobium marinum TaxID=3228790 RepID=A0ABV3QUH0_9HYPH
MSEIGKARRLARLSNRRSGRMLCVPLDHGMQVGPISGIADPAPLIDMVVEAGVDAVIVTPGMLQRHGHRLAGGPAVILRLDQTTMWRHDSATGYPDTHSRLVATVEDAVRMGAEAVITYLFTCNNLPGEETKSFETAGAVATECRKWGIVHVIEAMAAKGGFARADDPAIVALNCRMAGELGADWLKTDWCEADRFADVARQSLAPIAVAGGPALATLDDTVRFAEAAIGAGASGLMFGRNVFQHRDVPGALATLAKVVHGRV